MIPTDFETTRRRAWLSRWHSVECAKRTVQRIRVAGWLFVTLFVFLDAAGGQL